MAILQTQEYELEDLGLSVIIRSAVSTDATAVLSIHREVVEENKYVMTAHHEFHKTKESYQELIRAAGDHPSELFVVAAAEENVVGWLILYSPSLERRSHIREFGIMLSPGWRGQRIGKKLISTMLDWATACSAIEKICLEVFSSNENAIQLYRSFGFQEEGRRLKQIKLGIDHYVDLILMYKALR
ncbi:L-amino acid N-acyltransferase YncA [Paenibacillus sophorae]|uniref:GNAT family N-acetyltransferase n=1 Tax=Paenibacillus sophorae TaxID=1333845 RepID=A0A1H8NLW7_9BACL|nr:GNAT family N-acetyltransferase [Paenibacillus sophorae]QWU14557.1 GNAT family N-acetyltransferase [Paenibacillus sophorae]SEO30509.1 L-amino acid N-acyltransferase YncA [Paenibacillus sophorae]